MLRFTSLICFFLLLAQSCECFDSELPTRGFSPFLLFFFLLLCCRTRSWCEIRILSGIIFAISCQRRKLRFSTTVARLIDIFRSRYCHKLWLLSLALLVFYILKCAQILSKFFVCLLVVLPPNNSERLGEFLLWYLCLPNLLYHWPIWLLDWLFLVLCSSAWWVFSFFFTLYIFRVLLHLSQIQFCCNWFSCSHHWLSCTLWKCPNVFHSYKLLAIRKSATIFHEHSIIILKFILNAMEISLNVGRDHLFQQNLRLWNPDWLF